MQIVSHLSLAWRSACDAICLAGVVLSMLVVHDLSAQQLEFFQESGRFGVLGVVTAVANSPGVGLIYCETIAEGGKPDAFFQASRAPSRSGLYRSPEPGIGSFATGFGIIPDEANGSRFAYTEAAQSKRFGSLILVHQFAPYFKLQATVQEQYFGQVLLEIPGTDDVIVGAQRREVQADGSFRFSPLLMRIGADSTIQWRNDDLSVSGFLQLEAVHTAVWSGNEIHVSDADVARIVRVDPATGMQLGEVVNPFDDSDFLFGRTVVNSYLDTTWVATATVFDLHTYYIVNGQAVPFQNSPLGIADVFLDPYRLHRRGDTLNVYGGFGKLVNRFQYRGTSSSPSKRQLEIPAFRLDDRRLLAQRAVELPDGTLALCGAQYAINGEADSYLGLLDFDDETIIDFYTSEDVASSGLTVPVESFARPDGSVYLLSFSDSQLQIKGANIPGLPSYRPDFPFAPFTFAIEDVEQFADGELAFLIRDNETQTERLSLILVDLLGEIYSVIDLGSYGFYSPADGPQLGRTPNNEMLVMITAGDVGATEIEVGRYALDGTRQDRYFYDPIDGFTSSSCLLALPDNGFAMVVNSGSPRADPTFVATFDEDGDQRWRTDLPTSGGAYPSVQTLELIGADGMLMTTTQLGEIIEVSPDGSRIEADYVMGLPAYANYLTATATDLLYTSQKFEEQDDLIVEYPYLNFVDRSDFTSQSELRIDRKAHAITEIDIYSPTQFALTFTAPKQAGDIAAIAGYTGVLSSVNGPQVQAARELKVWPNPARAASRIHLQADQSGVEYSIVDALGLVRAKGITGRDATLKLPALTPGLYWIVTQPKASTSMPSALHIIAN